MARKRKQRSDQQTDEISAPEPTQKRRSQDAEPVTEQEAEQMFVFWRANKDTIGIKGVAKKFNRSRATVYRIAKRYNWDDRDARIAQQVREKSEAGIIKSEVKNLRQVKAVKELILDGLIIRDDKTGRPRLKRDPRPSDYVRICELEKLLTADLPASGGETGAGGVDKKTLQEALDVLKVVQALDPEIIKAIGDFCAGRDLPCFEIEYEEELEPETEQIQPAPDAANDDPA